MSAKVLRQGLTRVALVAGGLVLAVLLLEAVLQVAALFTPSGESWLIAQPATAKQRVICLGDSNTYGLYVERQQAFPYLLEQRWSGAESGPVEVLNLGVPATNSSKLRINFERILDTFKPNLALVMIGANDIWTAPVPIDGTAGGDHSTIYSIWRASRLFRLLYMIRRSLEADQLAIEYEFPRPGRPTPHKGVVRYGNDEFDLTFTGRAPKLMPDWERDLQRNLETFVDIAHAANTRLVLLTYPADTPRCYGRSNQAIRTVAAKTHTLLIDLAARFHDACPDEPCSELLRRDCHPTPRGHQLVAATVDEFLHRSERGS